MCLIQESDTKKYFAFIGSIVLIVKLLKISYFLGNRLYIKLKDCLGFGFTWDNLGSWAIITGGTDGIGKSYAEELAERGFNICLISRNLEKLENVATELGNKYNVETKVVSADFTCGPDVYKKIAESLKEIDSIGVLVNNVGMSYKYAEFFHEIPDGFQFMMDLIYSNTASCTMMMKMILPRMGDKGVIINVSSLMAIYPMPLMTTYAACKAFIDSISKAIQFECRDKNIVIQSVLPGYVATKMSARRTGYEIPSASTFVANAIRTVGTEDYTYGYWAHKIRGAVHEWLRANMPTFVNMAIAMHYMKKSRSGYFRRLERKRRAASKEETND